MSSQTATVIPPAPSRTRPAVIEFLFIDLTVCDRCVGTGDSLEAAIEIVRPALAAAGIDLEVRQTLVESEDQARALGFVSSPTIRVNGRDIAPVARETVCGSCDDVCGAETVCRVWDYLGQEHTTAPVGAIVEGILGEVFAPARLAGDVVPSAEVPENLQQFFAGKAHRQVETAACCPPGETASCCPPEAKAGCCPSGQGTGCGCR